MSSNCGREHGAQDVNHHAPAGRTRFPVRSPRTGSTSQSSMFDGSAGETTFDFARQLSSLGIPFIFATGYSETETLFEMFPGVAVVS